MKTINNKIVWLLLFFVVVSPLTLSAQMYNGINANQSVNFSRLKLNPAFVPENKVTFSVLTSAGLSFNMPTSIDKIVTKNSNGEAVLNLNSLISNINGKNIHQNTELDLLSLGIRVKNNFFSVQYGLGTEGGINFDKKFVDFLEKGNASRLGQNIDAGGLEGDLTSYHQVVLSYANSSLLDGKLTLGARMKLRYGVANGHFLVNKLNVYTSPNADKMIVRTDAELNFSASSLLDFEIENNGRLKDIKLKKDIKSEDVKKFSNLGIGFDFGASYKATNKLIFGLAITGLGKQKWKDNVSSFKQKEKVEYQGIDMINEDNNDIVDSTLVSFYQQEGKEYSVPFNQAVRLNCSYDLTKSLNAYGSVGLLTMYGKSLPEFNVVGTYTPVDWFSLALGTRYLNEQMNIGASLVMGTKLQLFLAVDNLIAMNYTSANQFGVRFGTSFNF